MPEENERKYVLPPNFPESLPSHWEKVEIHQGYIDGDGRTRIRQYNDGYIFTFKKFIESTQKLIEIESGLTQEDFEQLWPFCENTLTKTRFVHHINDEEFVIDYFKQSDGTPYFVMAEIEMPAGRDEPLHIPPEIKDHTIFSPEKSDDRFTSKRLSDPVHASNLIAELIS